MNVIVHTSYDREGGYVGRLSCLGHSVAKDGGSKRTRRERNVMLYSLYEKGYPAAGYRKEGGDLVASPSFYRMAKKKVDNIKGGFLQLLMPLQSNLHVYTDKLSNRKEEGGIFYSFFKFKDASNIRLFSSCRHW